MQYKQNLKYYYGMHVDVKKNVKGLKNEIMSNKEKKHKFKKQSFSLIIKLLKHVLNEEITCQNSRNITADSDGCTT